MRARPYAGRRPVPAFRKRLRTVPSPLLSVTIITLNEARRIERCLRSVAFADEIVVVDSGSTDDTVAIARRNGAIVLQTPDWPGFGAQKNRALDQAHGKWVLSIDADEEVTEPLRAAILAVVHGSRCAPGAGAVPATDATDATESGPAGYWVRRASTFCGRRLRFGDWSNDRVLRLFRREHARFSDDRVHERVLCEGALGLLDGLLLHRTVETIDDAHHKVLAYALAAAQRVADRGRGGSVQAVTHGAWSLVRGFVFRGGFLDGYQGWRLARCNALGTYLRYRFAGMSPQARRAYASRWAVRLGLDPAAFNEA